MNSIWRNFTEAITDSGIDIDAVYSYRKHIKYLKKLTKWNAAIFFLIMPCEWLAPTGEVTQVTSQLRRFILNRNNQAFLDWISQKYFFFTKLLNMHETTWIYYLRLYNKKKH